MYVMPNASGSNPEQPLLFSAPLKSPRVYTAAEKWLLPAAFLAALLFNRLLMVQWGGAAGEWLGWSGHAVFWLMLTAVFCVFNREKLAGKPIALLVGGLCVMLGVWYFLYPAAQNAEYAILTILALPFALMGFAQFVWGGFSLKQPGAIGIAWAEGFLIRPFSAIGKCFGAMTAILRPGRKGRGVRILIGCVCSLAILIWLVGMMREADMVVEYYVNSVLRGFDLARICTHAVFVFVFGVLLYSFLWNARYAKVPEIRMPEFRMDLIVCTIVLCSVLAAYALFSVVQFTFLFGRAGLPAGLTYSEYAVSGFWQLVGMAMFNLALFGGMLQYGPAARWFRWPVAGIIAATCMMLASAAVRLCMYIGVYGMTWLRLIAAWFLIYLAAVLVLCIVRLFWEKLPLISVSAILLLAWYVTLGYANPQGIIALFSR